MAIVSVLCACSCGRDKPSTSATIDETNAGTGGVAGTLSYVGATSNTRRLRRLGSTEYNNAVRDLLGDITQPATGFLGDAYQNGYDNGSVGLVVGSDQVTSYEGAAEALAATAVANLPRLLDNCDPPSAGGGEVACLDQFLASFPARAFRRPITESERTRLTGIYRIGADAGGFSLGLQLVIETVLQSPEFLYREELGTLARDPAVPRGFVRLTQYEIASELSFLLTQSAPDHQLLVAMAEGRFEGPSDYQREAARLLKTTSARNVMRRFLHLWLGTDRLADVIKDEALYPVFNRDLAASMSAELDKDFDKLLWGGSGSLRELFTSTDSFLDPTLAPVYGMSVAGPGSVPVSLDPSHRAGILTRAGFLTAHADRDNSGPVARGVFLLGSLLCVRPPAPPANVPPPVPVDTTIPDQQTTRQRFDQHVSIPACNGCHAAIDGIGFGFEEFDAVGAHRTTENGNPVDSSGTLIGTGDSDGPFSGVSELAGRLVGSQRLPDCFVKQVYRFAMGQVETDTDQPLVDALSADFSVDRSVLDLLLALVGDPAFVLRATKEDLP